MFITLSPAKMTAPSVMFIMKPIRSCARKMFPRVMPVLLTYSSSPLSSIFRLTAFAIMMPKRPWTTAMNTIISWANMTAMV